MSDNPFRSRGTGGTGGYQNNNALTPTRGFPENYLRSRTPSFDSGDDAIYFDGGTGVGARQSVRGPEDLYYESPSSPPPPPPDQNRRGSVSAMNRSQSQYFAGSPGGNGSSTYQSAPYSPGVPSQSYESTAPYPTTPGYNGNQTPQSTHVPYNPASYQPPPPPRRSNGPGYPIPVSDYQPQRHSNINTSGYSGSGGQFSPTTGTYNPSTFNSAPYPISYRPGGAQASSNAAPQPHPAQAHILGGYPQYPTRPQYPTHQSMYNSNQPYSPGLPQTQSAPPHAAYQPPPPPPPQHPPNSPSYTQASYGMYGNAPYPSSHNSSTLGHHTSLSTSSTRTYKPRPETHYNSGSDSDISGPSDVVPGHPLPSPPPKERQSASQDSKYGYGLQSLPSPPPPTPPAHGSYSQTHGYGSLPPVPDRSNSNSSRHPHSRPLPQAPEEDDCDEKIKAQLAEQQAAEELYATVEMELRIASSNKASNYDDFDLESAASPVYSKGSGPPYPSNGHRSNGRNQTLSNILDYYSNDSDTEGAAGLAMMQAEAAREELEKERQQRENPPTPVDAQEDPTSLESDSDYPMEMDITSLNGPGYYGSGVYGDDSKVPFLPEDKPPMPPPRATDNGQADSETSSKAARRHGGSYSPFQIPDDLDVHPFPEFQTTAKVDTWGTGGLADPSQRRRMSYDEGDEDMARSGSQSPAKRTDSEDDFPELFYHPSPLSCKDSPVNSRPLPSPPYNDRPEASRHGTPGSPPYPDSAKHSRQQSLSISSRTYSPNSPDVLSHSMPALGPGPQLPPRSTSLSSHTSTPQTIPPVRSKTDGKAHPARVGNRTSVIPAGANALGLGDSEVSAGLTLNDLPPIPLTRKFDPKKLSSRDFKKCEHPWALSAVSAWLKEITEGEQYLKEGAVVDGVVALFTHYVSTMNVADAETLAMKVVNGMLKERNLIKEEEWVKFGDGEVSGVIYQITGNGCYSPKLHEMECAGRCYSYHCARTLKKIKLIQHPDEPKQKSEDWATYWEIKKEDIAEVSRKEIERQNNLHEIVQTEEEFMEHLRILQILYRDQILHANPSVVKPTRMETFVREVFGKVDAVRKASEEHLLPQLKFRQREQGPWVMGFSDIFREWIRKAKTAYLDYAAAFPKANMLVRREAERNLLFQQFLDRCRSDPMSKRLDWATYLKSPITRLQRYSLLLTTVLKHTLTEGEEKQNLERAIEEIKAVTLECDTRVDEMGKRVTLLELGQKLIMRHWGVELRLEEKGRELIFKGDLQRNGNNRFVWMETHAILFDHYLVLAKTTMMKDGGAKHERYDVSRMPIPMDLLVLESTDDDPVIRNAANRLGIGGPATAKPGPTAVGGRTATMVVPAPGNISHTNTNSSTVTAPARLVTALPDQSNDNKVMYPFRIKALGNARSFKGDDNTYTLYAPSAANRQEWCDKIIMAKERHAASLHAQNAEPFRLKVMADAAFGYDTATTMGPKPIIVRGTPLDRAINEVEKKFDAPRPGVICRAAVNCATAFTVQHGREMVAIGTDYGVFTAEAHNPRGWSKALGITRVTQIAVLEEFSLFLALADKALLAYHLDAVVPPPGMSAEAATKQRPPQKLSGARDVGFFATGRMKDRSLVFYKKREAMSSTFKVLEPVVQKANEKKSRFLRKGTTEFFREFDDFYIPTDCYGINLFHSSLAIQTSKGFEVMTLDKKTPWSVPELRATHVADIASRLQGQKPLGMFRLSDVEFLLAYDECAVYVNKHGDISRSVIMEFVGRAKAVAIYGPYILIFDNDFVEIRNAQNGRLRQVIAGRDCRCLDDAQSGGSAGTRTIKVAMAHPEVEGRQLVVELILNEGQND
ncbi:Rho guanine nucleotide exchange factor [Rhizina undulata]